MGPLELTVQVTPAILRHSYTASMTNTIEYQVYA